MRAVLIPCLAAFSVFAAFAADPAPAETRLTIMTFNAWGIGGNDGRPVEESAAVIRAAGADIVGLQETRLEGPDCTADFCPPQGESRAAALAAVLGFHFRDQFEENPANWSNAILSRWPILGPSPNGLGVEIDIGGRHVWAFNIHLDDAPYQPYQLTGIDYGDAQFLSTEAEAIAAARATRGDAIALLMEDLKAAEGAEAVFLFGDFNEPSHRDWTPGAVAAGYHPIAVAWPATTAIEAAGFTDALRAAWPDEVAKPAWTWTPWGDPAATDDHQDRIDFVFARAPGLVIGKAAVLGEAKGVADIVVDPWPSDHRAIAAEISF
jgi:endonuclease/exonuclease/phosphatase family metal-dependent hydrolase